MTPSQNASDLPDMFHGAHVVVNEVALQNEILTYNNFVMDQWIKGHLDKPKVLLDFGLDGNPVPVPEHPTVKAVKDVGERLDEILDRIENRSSCG